MYILYVYIYIVIQSEEESLPLHDLVIKAYHIAFTLLAKLAPQLAKPFAMVYSVFFHW